MRRATRGKLKLANFASNLCNARQLLPERPFKTLTRRFVIVRWKRTPTRPRDRDGGTSVVSSLRRTPSFACLVSFLRIDS